MHYPDVEACLLYIFAVEYFIVRGYLLIPKYNNKNRIFHKYTGQGWARSQACAEKRTFQTLLPCTWSLSLFNEVRKLVRICKISI